MDHNTSVNIGEQRFDRIIEEDKFYMDKTGGVQTFEGKNLKKQLQILSQIDEKLYEAELIAKGFRGERIRKYGFAFRGKECLIGIHSIYTADRQDLQ